ncbi:MAG: glutamate--tRNA ligase family protein, partial [Patescibacteria group bacterium]
IKISWNDLIRGKIEFDTTELKDFVIAKNMETPLYHLAVVVDDLEMGVTHVIRGEDHISNTPRQMLIGRALGAPEFFYAHIPLILAPDKSKLSKRHGAVSVNEYTRLGYEPGAVINFLALMGWNPGDEREIFTLDELVKEFRLEKVQKGGAVFNKEKFDWVNKEHIKLLGAVEAQNRIKKLLADQKISDETIDKLSPIIIDRISRFGEIPEMIESGELDYFFAKPEYETKNLLWQKKPDPILASKHLEKVSMILSDLKDFSQENVKKVIWEYAEKEGRGEVLWPMRYALSGRDKSPDPFTLAYVLGKKETLERLGNALSKLKSDV